MRRITALAVALALALAMAACGGDDTTTATNAPAPAKAPIRIGTKNFTEQFILGELYSQALRAKGFDVQLKSNIGSTEITHRALTAGSLDMYPEYMSILLSEIAEVRDRPESAEKAYKLAKAFEERGGYTLLKATPFSDANALAVRPAYARRHRLRSIADLKRLKGRVQVVALPEFRNRYEGLTGLRDRYGLRNISLLTYEDSAKRYPTLDAGKVDVTLAFTTEGQLAGGRYVVLTDPRGVFAEAHAAPIIDEAVLEAHGPGLAKAIDAVSATLKLSAMRRMNKAVDIDERKPAAVAEQFLRSQGLVG